MIYDVIVGGAGPAGICAAIAAKRGGAKVLLIEDTAILGGTNTLSLVGPLMTYHNQGNPIIGGIAAEIIERLKQVKGTLGHLEDPLGFCSTVTPIDTEALKKLYFDMIVEYDIDLLLHTKIIHTIVEEGTIQAVTIANKSGVSNLYAKVFIDATGDGDLATSAGAKYHIGRDSDQLCQPMTMPFVVGNVDLNQLKKAMQEEPDNFVLSDKYDFQYIGISGFFKEVQQAKANHDFNIQRDRVLLFENVRTNEVTINMTRVLKHSALDAQALTKAEIEGRKQIEETFQFLKQYIPGFEQSYIVQTPYQIGVRETRHMICDYMMTKEDVLAHRQFSDAICVSAFPMDIHSPVGAALEVDDNPKANHLAFEIPLRCLLPKGLTNLIVTGRMIGATHEAAASLRVSPVCMALGEAAGVLGALSIQQNADIRQVSYQDVANQLKNYHQILKYQ